MDKKEIYICAHSKDRAYENELRTALAPTNFKVWSTEDIMAGCKRVNEINKHLSTISIFIVLISKYLLASREHVNTVDAVRYLTKYANGPTTIGVIISPVASLGDFKSYFILPEDGRSIIEYPIRDTIWARLVRYINV